MIALGPYLSARTFELGLQKFRIQAINFLRGVQPKFLGKLVLEIGVYQKAPPIGGTFGEVSESLRLL